MDNQNTLYVNPSLFKKALEHFGIDRQVDKLIEEMAELTQALQKFKYNKSHNVEEELMDVFIVMEQIKFAFDKVELAKWLNFKTIDLELKIQRGEE